MARYGQNESVAAKRTEGEWSLWAPESKGETDSVNQSFLYLLIQVLWKVAFIPCQKKGIFI